MGQMDPELERLDAQYDRIAQDLNQGHLTFDDAIAALDRLTTTDAQGNIWGLDKDGNWYTQVPGGPRQVSSPDRFVSPSTTHASSWATTPPNPTAPPGWGSTPDPTQSWGAAPSPGPAQWGADDLSSPPHPAQPHRTVPGSGPPPNFGPPTGPTWPPDGTPDDQQPRSPRIKSRSTSLSTATVTGYLKAHAKTVIFVVVVIVLLGILLTHHSKTTAATTSPTSVAPVTPGSTIPLTTVPGSTSPTQTTTQPPSTTQPAIPSAADIEKVVTALSSGNTATATAVVLSPGNAAQTYLSTSTLYGQLHLLKISTTSPSSSGTNQVQQIWTLSTSAGLTVAHATVTLKRVNGVWEVTTWPVFS